MTEMETCICPANDGTRICTASRHWPDDNPLNDRPKGPNFLGHRNPDRHRTVGPHRAWCDCGTWCYPRIDNACSCCREWMSDERPCPTCNGTGIAPLDTPTLTCQQCERVFIKSHTKGPTPKFCSEACRQRNHREKREMDEQGS